MNELINVNNETQRVSARELHEKLQIETRFNDWFPRMCEYGFTEGVDFYSKMSKTSETGGRPQTDYDITITMAKEICMLQRTETGRKIRQYFLDLEKAWNTPEQIMARALKVAQYTIDSLNFQIEEMKPKAEFFDAVADSKTAIQIGDVAKLLAVTGLGRNNLFEFLRQKKVIGKDNIPYQQYVDTGYFRVIEQKYTVDGEVRISIKTLVYQKGIDWIRRMVAAEYTA